MLHCSPYQLVYVWSLLEQAYYGDSTHGWIAEIYAYVLTEHSPVLNTPAGLHEEAKRAYHLQAAQTLFEILTLFVERRECSIEVDGRPLGQWLAEEPFEYRYHVHVRANGGKR